MYIYVYVDTHTQENGKFAPRIEALACRSVFRTTSRLDDKSPVTTPARKHSLSPCLSKSSARLPLLRLYLAFTLPSTFLLLSFFFLHFFLLFSLSLSIFFLSSASFASQKELLESECDYD